MQNSTITIEEPFWEPIFIAQPSSLPSLCRNLFLSNCSWALLTMKSWLGVGLKWTIRTNYCLKVYPSQNTNIYHMVFQCSQMFANIKHSITEPHIPECLNIKKLTNTGTYLGGHWAMESKFYCRYRTKPEKVRKQWSLIQKRKSGPLPRTIFKYAPGPT